MKSCRDVKRRSFGDSLASVVKQKQGVEQLWIVELPAAVGWVVWPVFRRRGRIK